MKTIGHGGKVDYLGEDMVMCTKKKPPAIEVACDKKATDKQKKEGLEMYYKMAASCPDWCVPGTEEDDGLGYGAAAICVTSDDVTMIREQIESMPNYKAFGTHKRFKAGPAPDVCRMATSAVKGFF